MGRDEAPSAGVAARPTQYGAWDLSVAALFRHYYGAWATHLPRHRNHIAVIGGSIMATILLTHLESPKGPANGATFTVDYDGNRRADVTISDVQAAPDAPEYNGLRAELVRLAWAIESTAQSPNGIVPAEPQQDSRINFEGRGPFEVVLQKPPTARVEGADVSVVLPVPLLGALDNKVDVRVILRKEHAEELAAQLTSALKMARVNSLKPR